MPSSMNSLNSSKETSSLLGHVGSCIVFAQVSPLGLLSGQNSAIGGGANPHGGTSSAPVQKTKISFNETFVEPAKKARF